MKKKKKKKEEEEEEEQDEEKESVVNLCSMYEWCLSLYRCSENRTINISNDVGFNYNGCIENRMCHKLHKWV